MNLDSIYILLNFSGVINILLICSFLWFRKQNTFPNILLSIILLIPGLYFVDNILISNKSLDSFPYFFFVVQFIANFFPICIYFYVHLLLGDKKKFNPLLLTGSVVCSLYSIGLFIHFIFQNPEAQSNFLTDLNSSEYPLSMDVYNYLFYAWQLFYFIVLSREVKNYRQRVENNLSDINLVKVRFVRQFVNLLFILNLSLIGLYIVFPMPVVDYGALPVITIFIYGFIIFFSIKHNVILTKDAYVRLNKINDELIVESSEKDQDLNYPGEDQLALIAEKMISALKKEKYYKNHDLTLTSLSELLDEKPYVLSKAINLQLGKNFNELINDLRIQEAIILLKTFDSKKEKIDTIALEAGFNSRATFYRSFKKITGRNPSDFVSNS
jgi:AraC-like DNA-binding protein